MTKKMWLMSPKFMNNYRWNQESKNNMEDVLYPAEIYVEFILASSSQNN